MVAEQMERTLQDLRNMEKLSGSWVVRMNESVERLDEVLSSERRRSEEKTNQENEVLNLQKA